MTPPLVQATGRRKRAVARVRVRPGQGRVTINGREIEAYFPSPAHRSHATEALSVTDTSSVYDVDATISGGDSPGRPEPCVWVSPDRWRASTPILARSSSGPAC